eukprot:CAMPEP_0115857086 /NCGR_PEP_ID=MMETSP0287-20121206/15392_1 /TAXON_ID=412157 /ORGANISM="Chrysochromulina rotalis, Strain UIO044" /LENGTH=110 /DNA_ID=CAMNT_0003311291 /DNA_START=559 /DNA_END=892 /DNA_ORIENTATION=-
MAEKRRQRHRQRHRHRDECLEDEHKVSAIVEEEETDCNADVTQPQARVTQEGEARDDASYMSSALNGKKKSTHRQAKRNPAPTSTPMATVQTLQPVAIWLSLKQCLLGQR